jgi:hypothetical protein
VLTLQDTVLALALVLSTATQLRAAGGAVGPGEACLVIWLALVLGREAGRLGPKLTPVLSLLLIFWVVFALAQGLGMVMGLATEEIRDPASALHDTISYVLLAAVSCLSVVEPGAGARLRRVAWRFVTLGTVALAVLLANARGLVTIPGVVPWFWERMQGWSDNPNQLALLCAALGLVALHLAETTERHAGKAVAVLCGVLPIYVGGLSGSDTFKIVLLITGPVFIALKLRTWLMSIEGRLTFRSAAAWIVVLALPLVLASTVLLGSAIAVQMEDVATHMSKGGGKEASGESKLRLALWSEALSRGIDSGLLGLGPGAHLVSTPYKRLPPPNFEAHNTPLDLFTQGGLLAVLSFAWLVATGIFRTYKSNLAGLTVLLSGLAIFGMFHLIVRHPIFWFAIALGLVAGTGRTTSTRYGS